MKDTFIGTVKYEGLTAVPSARCSCIPDCQMPRDMSKESTMSSLPSFFTCFPLASAVVTLGDGTAMAGPLV